MKKLLSTVLCLVLAFAITCSFAGCSDDKKSNAPASAEVQDIPTSNENNDEADIEELFDDLIACIESGDAEDFLNLTIFGALSKEQIEEMSGISYSEMMSAMEEEVMGEFFQYDSLSLVIDDISYYEDEDVEDFNSEMEGYLVADKIADVEFTITVDGDTDSDSLGVAKINGKWYLADF